MKGVDTGKMVKVPAKWLAEAQSIILTGGNEVPVPNQLARVFALLVEMAREGGSDVGVALAPVDAPADSAGQKEGGE